MELRQELQGRSKILKWSDCYDVDYDTPIKNLVCGVKDRGYLKKPELVELAKWKVRSGRNTVKRVKKNSPADIKKFTRAAFRATVDDSICYLYNHRPGRDKGLRGVRIPVGSAILHWFHEDRYPIWDPHARWSVQLDKSQYKNDFERWKAYVEFCRDKAHQYEVDMRTLDRALFVCGKKNC